MKDQPLANINNPAIPANIRTLSRGSSFGFKRSSHYTVLTAIGHIKGTYLNFGATKLIAILAFKAVTFPLGHAFTG
jgi:hypothetical protein